MKMHIICHKAVVTIVRITIRISVDSSSQSVNLLSLFKCINWSWVTFSNLSCLKHFIHIFTLASNRSMGDTCFIAQLLSLFPVCLHQCYFFSPLSNNVGWWWVWGGGYRLSALACLWVVFVMTESQSDRVKEEFLKDVISDMSLSAVCCKLAFTAEFS